MTDEEALQALAAVDRFRQAGAAAAEAIGVLVAAMAGNGCSQRTAYMQLGLTDQVAQWARRQRSILERGDASQQQVLMELLSTDDDQPDLHQLLIRWCAS